MEALERRSLERERILHEIDEVLPGLLSACQSFTTVREARDVVKRCVKATKLVEELRKTDKKPEFVFEPPGCKVVKVPVSMKT